MVDDRDIAVVGDGGESCKKCEDQRTCSNEVRGVYINPNYTGIFSIQLGAGKYCLIAIRVYVKFSL